MRKKCEEKIEPGRLQANYADVASVKLSALQTNGLTIDIHPPSTDRKKQHF